METTKALEKRIVELKEALPHVEGTKTEVYSRIVGYYRPVNNWNKGKKEEFGLRKMFTEIQDNHREASPSIKTIAGSSKEDPVGAAGYLYFYRQTCPNCPPVSRALKDIDLPGKRIDVDTDKGLETAGEFNVLTAPTVVFTNMAGKEVFRTSKADAVRSAVPTAGSERLTV